MSISKVSLAGAAAALLLVLQSCIGISSDIVIRSGGSGTITLEYRISKMLESMGKLDGNEQWLPLPVGRTDFERSVARVPGLSLSSYSMGRTDEDITVKAELAFADLAALAGFLDAGGRSAQVAADGAERVLTLRLSDGGGPLDADLDTLVKNVFSGYTVTLRFTAPAVPAFSLEGAQAPGRAQVTQRTATYSAPVYDLLSSSGPVNLRLSWRE